MMVFDNLPLSGYQGWEGFKNRDKSEDLPDKAIFSAFGKKSAGSTNDSILVFLHILGYGK
jgi:hypothetical protein